MENKKTNDRSMKKNWLVLGILAGILVFALAAYVITSNGSNYKALLLNPNQNIDLTPIDLGNFNAVFDFNANLSFGNCPAGQIPYNGGCVPEFGQCGCGGSYPNCTPCNSNASNTVCAAPPGCTCNGDLVVCPISGNGNKNSGGLIPINCQPYDQCYQSCTRPDGTTTVEHIPGCTPTNPGSCSLTNYSPSRQGCFCYNCGADPAGNTGCESCPALSGNTNINSVGIFNTNTNSIGIANVNFNSVTNICAQRVCRNNMCGIQRYETTGSCNRIDLCSRDTECATGGIGGGCGDGICSLGEDPLSCPADCGGTTSSGGGIGTSHLSCVNNTCTIVAGAGTNTCLRAGTSCGTTSSSSSGGTSTLAITSLNPNTSPVGRATTVTITGTGFDPSTNTVRFTSGSFSADIRATLPVGGQCGNNICDFGETRTCPADCRLSSNIESENFISNLITIPQAEAQAIRIFGCVVEQDPNNCEPCPVVNGQLACLCQIQPGQNGCQSIQFPEPSCGDGICSTTLGESALTCPADCSSGTATCGDGICQLGESCLIDCGTSTGSQLQFIVPANAPVGTYTVRVYTGAPTTNPTNISNGLPYVITPVCGNNICEAGETPTSCPADCGNGNINSGNGNTNSGNTNINSNPACALTNVLASAVPNNGTAPLNVNFNAALTTLNCPTFTCSWSFGDGPQTDVLTGCTPLHTYTNPGTYQPTVTLTRSTGETTTKSVTVTVTKPVAQCKLPGDVNADNRVDISDLSKMANYLSLDPNTPLDDQLKLCGDVTCDGKIDISDLAKLSNYLSLDPNTPALNACPGTGGNSNTNSGGANVTLSSLQPANGPVGTVITIQGTGFSPVGNSVHFDIGGSLNLPSTNNGTVIQYQIPATVSICNLVDPNSQIVCKGLTKQVIPGTYQLSVTNTQGVSSNNLSFTVTSGSASDFGYKCVGATNSIPPSYVCQACVAGEAGCTDLNTCSATCSGAGTGRITMTIEPNAVYFIGTTILRDYFNELSSGTYPKEFSDLDSDPTVLDRLRTLILEAPYMRVVTFNISGLDPRSGIKAPEVRFFQKKTDGTFGTNGSGDVISNAEIVYAPGSDLWTSLQFKKYYTRLKGTDTYCEVALSAPTICLKQLDTSYFDAINSRLAKGNETWATIDGAESNHGKVYFYTFDQKYSYDIALPYLCENTYVYSDLVKVIDGVLPLTEAQKSAICLRWIPKNL